MNVYGYEVEPHVMDTALSIIRAGNVKAGEVEAAITIISSGIDEFDPITRPAITGRIVDRLLQRERKAGRIRFSGGVWEKVS